MTETILFLVESPHKAETLTHFLGKEYKIMASVGHVMDLDPSNMSIDIEHDFAPIYIQNKDKTDVIAKIKSAAKKAKKIIFASDPDREGEMISWSLAQILGVKKPQRVTYTEITKTAVLDAIKHPRELDMSLIDAQKTRRILDRIVGYEISPLLMKILSIMHLSAGRVQSVVARLIVDKEMEIRKFFSQDTPSFFKFSGEFKNGEDILKATLFGTDKNQKTTNDEDDDTEKGVVKIPSSDKAKELMELFCKSKFGVGDISEKKLTRHPASPFSTSSMQQAGANKLGFTVKRTMTAAQNLYEAGLITYLRTDSINLSEEALDNIGKYIMKKYGSSYYHKTQYKSKGKNTQEAHEAIRPTDINKVDNLEGKKIGNDEVKLYSLIWKRTVASQMTPAIIKQITIHIAISNASKYEFLSKSEAIEFAGYLKVYNIEDVEEVKTDKEEVGIIKNIPKLGTKLEIKEIVGKQSYQKPPSRYNDGTLVNKMKPENLNIGRPATTQNMITLIQDRKYVEKKDVEGIEKDAIIMKIGEKKKVETSNEKVSIGKELNRFVPTELGIRVNEFLMKYFPTVMDYQFTSEMEEDLDKIAEGEKKWLAVMKKFYKDFHPIVEKVKAESKELIKKNTKVIGQYPKTGEDIIVALAQYGPVVKMKRDGKYIYAPIQYPLTMETVTLKDAIKLFEYPKNIGKYKDVDIMLQKGKFGYYLTYDKEKISIKDKSEITLEDAIEEIKKKETKNLWKITDGKVIYKVLDGQFGMYVNVSGLLKKSLNVKLPKDTDVKELTLEKIKEIVANRQKKKFFKKKKAE